MLSLASSLSFGDLILYRDAERSSPPHLFVRRTAPLLGRGPDGEPDLHLILYRGALEHGQPVLGGGLATLSVVLSPTDEERAQLDAALPDLLRVTEAPVFLPFPARSARVSFAVAVSDSDLRSSEGSDEATLSGDNRASALFELSPDGVAQILAEGGAPRLWVRYEIGFLHRLSGLRMRLWCDTSASHRAISTLDLELLRPDLLRETLVQAGLAGLKLEEQAETPPEYTAKIREAGEALLAAALSAALVEDDASGQVRPRQEPRGQSLNLEFRDGQAMEAVEVAEALLPVELAPSRILRVDLGASPFSYLEVRIRCRADFERSPIDKVKITLRYGPHGEEVGEHVFSDSTQVALFRPRRREGLLSYAYTGEVFYRGGSPPRRLPEQESTDTLLILEVGQLGVLEQTLRLGALSDSRVERVRVSLSYGTLTYTTLLDADHPETRWAAVLDADAHPEPRPTGPIRYKLSWLLRDGERVESEEREHSDGVLWVGDPPQTAAGVPITLISAGSFAELAFLLVELRAGPDQPVTELEFPAVDTVLTWTCPVPAEIFEIRTTSVSSSGERWTSHWLSTSERVQVVRDLLRFSVRILPRLLQGGGWLMARLELSDLEQIQTETFDIADFVSELTWSFSPTDPERTEYRYRLTLVSAHERLQRDWTTSSTPLLVLK